LTFAGVAPMIRCDVSYEHITYELSDPVATITLNRPDKLNAWTERMGREVRHAVAQAERDPRAVAIVLTGAGRGFCAGADMQLLSSLAASGSLGSEDDPALAAEPGNAAMRAFRGAYSYFPSVAKPVIAAINGPCAGMAVPIALFCDLRFCSDRATFITAFSRRGLIAEWGVSWILPRLVGPSRALDLLLSSRTVDAAEAERIGLVNRVIPHDELLHATRAYVVELATYCSPASMAVMKREVYEHLTETLDRAEADALGLMAESIGRPDFGEGVAAFLEKRPPRFARIGSKNE
jgi:enoyl-CoA hydratase/carnithine racemase